jgi:hypothetical protein
MMEMSYQSHECKTRRRVRRVHLLVGNALKFSDSRAKSRSLVKVFDEPIWE